MALKIRRGTDAQRQGKVFESGEIVWTTDGQQLWVGDLVGTPGGVPVVGANVAGYGLIYNAEDQVLEVSGLTTDDVEQGTNANRKYFSPTLAQDAAASLFTTGSHTNIEFQYDDVDQKINATVTLDGIGILNVQDDTSPSLGGDLTLNSHNITGTGNINITGTLTGTSFTGNLLASDSSTVINGTSKALTISSIAFNTGGGYVTGNQLVVQTSSNAFVTQSYNASNPWISFLQNQGSNAAVTNVTFARSRGTTVSPTTIQTNDQILNIAAAAYTGSAYTPAGALVCLANGAVSAGVAPSAWVFRAADSAGVLQSSFAVSGDGVQANKVFQIASYTTTQRNALTPAYGQMIYNTTTNTFQGYQNTGGVTPEWVDLS